MFYAFIENNKINGKGECFAEGEGLQCVEISEEVYNNLDHYIWDGEKIVENPNYEQEEYERQYEEVKQLRECAYAAEVDTITAHINRLRDKEQTPEIISEIEELKQERDAKYLEIQERYPYPEEPK